MAQSKRWSAAFFVLLNTAIITFVLIDRLASGWSSWLPGPMIRHRDAVAVAITAVAHGKWDGYASYKSVERKLMESGFDVTSDGYLRAMVDAGRSMPR